MKLFWKLFPALLASLVFIAAASSWLAHRWQAESARADAELARLEQLGEQAAGIYLERGPRVLARWLRRAMAGRHAQAFLLDADGFNLLPRPVPPTLAAYINDALAGRAPRRQTKPPFMLSLKPVIADGETFHWLVRARMPPEAMREQRRRALALRLAVGAAVMAMLAWLLSLMLTRPIHALRRAALRLGEGCLDARAPASVAARGDEIGDLARAFDQMAERLAGLVNSHKQLLRDVSHELRSPLARLRVALELARNETGDAARPELDRIALEADRLDDLIGEVLALARLEQGAADARREHVNIPELLREVVADAAFEAEHAGKRVRLAGELPAVAIRGDRAWLARALDNVIRNAIRHAPPETGVDIQARVEGGVLRIVVRDHGPGVRPEALARLFEPFFRAGGEGEGHGLGLAIARRVALAHGGDITAENATDGGLRVCIRLPLSPEAPAFTA